MPKTLKQQRIESVAKGKGYSIKITKPRLTIDGFIVDKENMNKNTSQPTVGHASRSSKSLKTRESASIKQAEGHVNTQSNEQEI